LQIAIGLLPDEFVLKKYIVALVIALNILLCNIVEDFIQTDTNVIDLIIMAAIINKVKIIKTTKHVFREIDHHNNVVDGSSVVLVSYAVTVLIL